MQAQELGLDPEARFGQGDFPAVLDRVNWGAILLGGLWAVINGVWPAALALITLRVLAFGFFLSFGQHLNDSAAMVLAVSLGAELLNWIVLGWFGMHANALAWRSENRRIASGQWQPPGLTLSVQRYLDNQRNWVGLGALLLLMGYAMGYQRLLQASPLRANGAVWAYLVAPVALLVIWLLGRKRALKQAGSS